MAEKLKKKKLILSLDKSGKNEETINSPLSPSMPLSPLTPNGTSGHIFIKKSKSPEVKGKRFSEGGLKDLVQCPLCLETLHHPKMLPCQHTYCLACLTVYVADKQVTACPICRTHMDVSNKDFLQNLPPNLYIDSLISLLNNGNKPKPLNNRNAQSVELFSGAVVCSQCKFSCDSIEVTCCRHCKQKFCKACWRQHFTNMRIQYLNSIVKQLESASNSIEHKIENYKDRCDYMTQQIKTTAQNKCIEIMEQKEELVSEIATLQQSGENTGTSLKVSLDEAKSLACKMLSFEDKTNDDEQVSSFMTLHQNTVKLLADISKWDTERFAFDPDSFRIEMDAIVPLDAESDEPISIGAKLTNPLESEDTLVSHYKSRNFIPHYVWRKTTRPGGIAIDPWENNLYVCNIEKQCIAIIERSQAKIVERLTCEEMLRPVHIAFIKSLGEVYVTDKWKHTIHVFSKTGEFLRSLGSKGKKLGYFMSPEGIATDEENQLIYVADTGNYRIQIIQPDGTAIDQIGVSIKQQIDNTASIWQTKDSICTELSTPTSVAVTHDRIIILDTGHRRVKVYNKKDKSKMFEFGSVGQRKGQFRQPEVLFVDPMGFILVGDSGNSRVQIFKPNGQVVRVFGGVGSSPGKFGWISGLYVTNQLDIIVSDTRNQCVNLF